MSCSKAGSIGAPGWASSPARWSTAPGSGSVRRITASFAFAMSGGRSTRSTCPIAEAPSSARSSRPVAAPGRHRQPAVLLQPLAALGGTEQGPLAASGAVIAAAILLGRLLALAAQLDQAGVNGREIVGGTGSGHGFPPRYFLLPGPQAGSAGAKVGLCWRSGRGSGKGKSAAVASAGPPRRARERAGP